MDGVATPDATLQFVQDSILTLGVGAGFKALERGIGILGSRVAAEGSSSFLAYLRAGIADDTGAIGPGVGDLKFARGIKVSIDNPVVPNRSMTVNDFISQFREAGIRAQIPGEYLDQSVEDALRSGNSTVRKLLIDGRWAKK